MTPKAPANRFIDPTDLLEVIQSVVVQVVRQTVSMPEVATFSGDSTDVKVDEIGVLLRLQQTRVRDGEGKPHELWARLVGANGDFIVPTSKTEMLVIHIADAEGVPGAAWCFWGVRKPPQKVTQALGRQELPATVNVCRSAGGWCWRGGPDQGSFVQIDPTSGMIQLSHKSGSHLAYDPASNAFEILIAKTGTTKSVFRVDENGVYISSGGKIVAQWDGTSGKFLSMGSGDCQLVHTHGLLGPVGATTQPLLAGTIGASGVPCGWAASTG